MGLHSEVLAGKGMKRDTEGPGGLMMVRNHDYKEDCRGKQGEDGVVKGHRTTARKEEDRKIFIFNLPNPTRNQGARKSRYCSP